MSLPSPAFDDPKHHLRLYQGDCLELLPLLPESSVDLIFADPPYFLSNGGITCHAGKMVSVHKGDWDKSRGPQANHDFNLQWLAACQRLLKPNGSLWVSGTAHVIHSVGFALQQLGFKLLNDISWVKPNPPPNLSCRYFTHATETIIWAAKNAKSRHTFNYKLMKDINRGKQMKSVWEIRPPESWEKKFGKHPTQKPVALLERILLASSNEGDLILDPFSGSGTTLLAAFRLRRHALGCEFSADFLTLSLRRLCSNLVHVELSISSLELSFSSFDFPVDPPADPMDRSSSTANPGCARPTGQLEVAVISSGASRRFCSSGSLPVNRSACAERPLPLRASYARRNLSSFFARGKDPNLGPMSTHLQLVQQESRFYFIGRADRRVIFSVQADSLEDARQKFRASGHPDSDALFIIKTETSIYLA